jgi:hypothetical protein
VNKAVLLIAAASALVACDARGPEPVNPSLASLANIFGFDALRGKVKHFTQTQKEESGKISAQVSVTLDKQGCVQQLRSFQPAMKVDVDLVKEGDYFVDRTSRKKMYQLDAQCRLERTVDGSLRYKKDAQGFITDVISTETDDAFAGYRYDALGYPRHTLFQNAQGKTEIDVKEDAPDTRRTDATLEARVDGRLAGITKTRCHYDAHFNPVQCAAAVVAEGDYGSATLNYTQTYQTTYY